MHALLLHMSAYMHTYTQIRRARVKKKQEHTLPIHKLWNYISNTRTTNFKAVKWLYVLEPSWGWMIPTNQGVPRVKRASARDVIQILTNSSFAVSSEGSSILWRFCRRINHKGRRPPESSFQCWNAEGPQPLPPCHGKAAGDTGHFIRGPRTGVWWGGMTSAALRHLLTSGNKVC